MNSLSFTALTGSDNHPFSIHIPELLELEHLIGKLAKHGRIHTETEINYAGLKLPIHALEFGPEDPTTPVVVFVGGVHGLERIGSQIIIEYLKTFKELLYWDGSLAHLLSHCRVLFIPMLNPVGIFAKTRCNANGVDLMRNAPIDADEKPAWGIVGGHRISSKLPWYRGVKDEPMQAESQALVRIMKQRVFPSSFAISLDIHSGFGGIDRLWFPYAYSRRQFPNYMEMFALKRKLDQALPNHVYRVEPQNFSYLTHGDLWDYLYLEFKKQHPQKVYLPLTLEIGSWLWIKKNPIQLFNVLGAFNPLLPHRTRRILRRHISLIDFLMRLTSSYKRWSNPSAEKRAFYEDGARATWYPDAC